MKNMTDLSAVSVTNLSRSGAAECIILGCWTVDNTPWNQVLANNRDFLPTPPAFDAVVSGVPVGILPPFGMEKLAWCGWLPDGENNFEVCAYSFRQNIRTWLTDGRTPRDGIGREKSTKDSIVLLFYESHWNNTERPTERTRFD